MLGLWFVCIIATWVIADQKRLSVGGYVLLSVLTGPLAVLIVLLVPSQKMKRPDELQELRGQLNDLRRSVFFLQQRVDSLEGALPKPDAEPITATEAMSMEKPSEIRIEEAVVAEENVSQPPTSTDMELNFGRNWLNKIGIVVFTLGMGFLISYTFKYFGPFFKIAFGYLVGAGLFFLGVKLEARERFVNFGRVLLGGGWALVYFTTYAMHHFPGSRLIENQMVDLFLLGLVVLGMMAHVLKYKSEGMMSVALFVAYITATLGEITGFTVVSCLLLAVGILFLVYQFQWIRTLVLGIVMTYGIHYVWIMPRILSSTPGPSILGIPTQDYHLLMNFLFITAYGLVFLIGTHVVRTVKDPHPENTIAGVNFFNIAFYGALAYPLILKLFYARRFEIVLGAGALYLVLALLMKRLSRTPLYLSDVTAGIFLLTFAVPLKFVDTFNLLIWLVEIPFLLFISFRFKEKIYRYLSYGLSVWVSLRLVYLNFEGMFLTFGKGYQYVHWFNFTLTWQEFMSLWAAVSMAVCFYLIQRAKTKGEWDDVDRFFDQVFSGLSFYYLTSMLPSWNRQPWVAFTFAMEGVILLMASMALSMRRFRLYAYLSLAFAAGVFMLEEIHPASSFLKWFLITADVLLFFAVYVVMKYFKRKQPVQLFFACEQILPFWVGLTLLVSAVFQYLPERWITLTLGLLGVAVILIGLGNKDKIERWGGLLLFALTLGRLFLVDLSGLDIIFKIITFIILGVVFLGISFVYTRFGGEPEKGKENFPPPGGEG